MCREGKQREPALFMGRGLSIATICKEKREGTRLCNAVGPRITAAEHIDLKASAGFITKEHRKSASMGLHRVNGRGAKSQSLQLTPV